MSAFDDPLMEHLGAKERVDVTFTLGEVAALLGIAAGMPTEAVNGTADNLTANGEMAGVHLLIDFSSSLIKLGDALAKVIDGKRYAGFTGQVAEIEQLRARIDEDAA